MDCFLRLGSRVSRAVPDLEARPPGQGCMLTGILSPQGVCDKINEKVAEKNARKKAMT